MILKIILSIALIFVGTAQAAPIDVPINLVRDKSTYMLDLLKLALSYSDRQYRFVELDERLSKSAEREAAVNGKIGIFWGGTSEEEERDFIPVRIDAYRGLMSLRFFIIRKSDQSVFSSVVSLEDLQRLKMGQGCAWKDSNILAAAGLSVECSHKKEGLFFMLDGGRFDAFPRGATEAWEEVAGASSDLNLMVEKSLVIKYPLPTFYFVNKGLPGLAADIENGLKAALADGAFDKFFYSNDRVQSFLENADLENRRVISLKNPFMTEKSEAIDGVNSLSIEDLIEGKRRLKAGEFN